jgi:protein phosphatase
VHPQRSLVLEALDGRPRERVGLRRVRARAGDRLLLCSDGLSDMVDDEAIADALREPSREACAERLVALALAAGGRDNVSVVVADVVERRGSAAAWAAPPR